MGEGLPGGFEDLQRFVDAWALETQGEREVKRRAASRAEMTEFFKAVLPQLETILAECDKYPLGGLPASHRPLFNLALSVAEVAPHVEHYQGSPKVPHAFEEERMVARHADRPTWKG